MFSTLAKGNSLELLIASKFIELGFTVSFPYGNNARYDLLVDIRGKIYRVQCKTSRKQGEGKFVLPLRSSHLSGGRAVQLNYSKDEIDFFATIIENEVCLIPISSIRSTAVVTIYTEKTEKGLFKNDFLMTSVIGRGNVMDVKMCRDIRVKNKRKVYIRKRKISKTILVSHIPTKEELEELLKHQPIYKIARQNHIAHSTVRKLISKYNLDVNPGHDSERMRAIGTFDRIGKTLKRYYESHTPKNTKRVIQYSAEGNLISTFSSARSAANEIQGTPYQIKRVCYGSRKRYKGFVWRFEGDSF